ncbi:MAG: hypothetical protein VX223_08860, partial [Myxococcota bacterium]|nr:hypothetical protein [Myxococcota bacterium]
SGGGSGGGTTGGPVATKANGEQCNSAVECQSGLCVGGSTGTYYCRAACTLGGNECPSNEECYQLQGSGNGACIPVNGSSGAKPPGSACASPGECISGLCIGPTGGGYFCREGCNPALNNCPELFACAQLVGGGGACIPANPKLGLAEPCDFSDDCESGFCLSVVGTNDAYCSQACGECPCGMECSSFQGGQNYCTIGGPSACIPSGNPCDSADECISQTCVAGICADPCIVGSASCPPGKSCKRLKSGSQDGTCADAGPRAVGDPCDLDSDCESNFCDGRCRLPCDPATTYCGPGLACLPLEGESVGVCQEAPDSIDGFDGGSGVEGTDGTSGQAVDGTTDGQSGTIAGDSQASGCQWSGTSHPISMWMVLCTVFGLITRRKRSPAK